MEDRLIESIVDVLGKPDVRGGWCIYVTVALCVRYFDGSKEDVQMTDTDRVMEIFASYKRQFPQRKILWEKENPGCTLNG